MTSVIADGAHAVAVDGDFDDCQDAVKALFRDLDFRDRVGLSAINSINWARLMPQIVYYATAALKLGAPDREVAFAVPTGNFGNIFAGYAACCMGLPIKRLICASNRNDILTRFFASGAMERQAVELRSARRWIFRYRAISNACCLNCSAVMVMLSVR